MVIINRDTLEVPNWLRTEVEACRSKCPGRRQQHGVAHRSKAPHARRFEHRPEIDPRAAIAVDERIATQVLLLLLLQFPEGGRPGRIEGTRELIVRRTPYIVAYRGRKGLRSHPANSSQRAVVAWRTDRPAAKRG
ncbi:hypothetical protein LJR290_005943 [Variovorax sp. LjRoot290]|uniref:hypothetical protein n=1 Tax=unclassified Variovorax TaxID=663243 RepID=UPI003ECF7CDE